MKKILALILVLCMALTLFVACAGDPAPAPTTPATTPAAGGETTPAAGEADFSDLAPFKLGIITPLTGAGAQGGVEYDHGARIAMQHLADENGVVQIQGREIELVVADGPNADASNAEFDRLVDEGVTVFSSGYGSMADMYAIAMADELEVLYMGMTWSDAVSEDIAGSEYYYRLGQVNLDFGADCINYSVMVGEKYLNKAANEMKVAVVYNTNQTPIAEAIKAKAAELGVEVVLYEGYPLDNQDFIPLITKLQNTEFDVFIPVQSAADGAAFQKKINELGYKPRLTIAAGIFYDLPTYGELGNEITENVMTVAFVNPTAPESACPGITKFVEDYEAEYGYMPLTHALMAYCQILVQYELLSQVSPDQWEDTALLAETFANMDIAEGVLPWYRGVKFDENNQNTRAAWNMLCQWQNGELVSVLPDQLTVKPIVIPEA